MRALVWAVVALTFTGCASVSTTQRPDDYYTYADTSGAGETETLFAGDAAVLSDDAIRRILDYAYEPPELSRVALLPFGRELWSAWSEELAIASQDLDRKVIDNLQASPRIYDASILPSILIPETRTVPHLREAAARYQADLLLVYRSYCRTFERYRFLSANESRAYCGVEAVLLDTRTGLVPFTSVAFERYTARRNDDDTNFRETVLKAQLTAVTEALSKVSDDVRKFLDSA